MQNRFLCQSHDIATLNLSPSVIKKKKVFFFALCRSVIDRRPTGGWGRGFEGAGLRRRHSGGAGVGSWEEVFLGEQARRGERERAVGGRRRHQLLDRRANDRLYMQTPPAAGRRLFPPQITQFALFLSRCARIPSLLFHYFAGDFGAAIFVSVKQQKKKMFPALLGRRL